MKLSPRNIAMVFYFVLMLALLPVAAKSVFYLWAVMRDGICVEGIICVILCVPMFLFGVYHAVKMFKDINSFPR